MKRIALKFVLVLCFFFVPTTVRVSSASAVPDSQFLFCSSASLNPDLRQWFYTAIFTGDRAIGKKYSDGFGRYLQDTYPDRNPGPAGCRFYGSESAARSDKRTLQAASNADSVETGWTYSQ